MEHTVLRPARERRVRKTLALRRDQFNGLVEQAAAERHENVSLIVQRAIDRELERCKQERGEVAA